MLLACGLARCERSLKERPRGIFPPAKPSGFIATQQARRRPSFRPTTKHLRFNLPGFLATLAIPNTDPQAIGAGMASRGLPTSWRPYLSVLVLKLCRQSGSPGKSERTYIEQTRIIKPHSGKISDKLSTF